ncbi:MAG: tetratricopeptide repeat protein, partial [Saprospiraceae bacterium]|nr:tetratricopeptide repeat protein [Saprospiraceae bacterium]
TWVLACTKGREKVNDRKNLTVNLFNLSEALLFAGKLDEARDISQRALQISKELKDVFKEGNSLFRLGLALSIQGQKNEGKTILEQSIKLWKTSNHIQPEGVANAYFAQHYLWHLQPNQALIHANIAWELAHENRNERDFIRAACRQGQAALGLGQYDKAAERLHHALERARKINDVQEELPALIALAELARQQGHLPEARELLEGVWDAAERGPFPFFHADALCVLCEIERAEGNKEAAKVAAEEAYRLALAQGEPYVYRYGLDKAKQLLASLSS